METLDALIELLGHQKIIYKGLLDISKKKKEVLIEGKIQELENITKAEQTLVLNIGKLEEQLEDNINKLKKELSINEDEVNISTIIGYLPNERKPELESLKNEIFEIIQELNKLNQSNSALIQNSLDYIKFSVNLLSETNSNVGGGYGQKGDVQTSKTSFFDKKS